MGSAPCVSCDGRCCRRYSVELTVFDIRRLSLGLDVTPSQFCATVESWSGRCGLAPSLIDGQHVNIVLRRTADDACMFFRGGASGCGVYDHRPRPCAIYPHRLADAAKPRERDDALCPLSWSGRTDLADVASHLTAWQWEVRAHNRLVRSLNADSVGDLGLEAYLSRLLVAFEIHLA